MTFGWYIFHVILYQLFNVSNLSLYNQDRNWVAFQYSSVVSQSPSDHTTSGLYLLTISYSSGIVFVCKIKAKKYKNTTLRMIKNLFCFFFFNHYKCEGKYFELKECKCKLFFLFQSCSTYSFTFFKLYYFFLAYIPWQSLVLYSCWPCLFHTGDDTTQTKSDTNQNVYQSCSL